MKRSFRFTIKGTYSIEASAPKVLEAYGTLDFLLMAKIDEQELAKDPKLFLEFADSMDEFYVTPILESDE